MTIDTDIMEDLAGFISNDLIIFISDIQIMQDVDKEFIQKLSDVVFSINKSIEQKINSLQSILKLPIFDFFVESWKEFPDMTSNENSSSKSGSFCKGLWEFDICNFSSLCPFCIVTKLFN